MKNISLAVLTLLLTVNLASAQRIKEPRIDSYYLQNSLFSFSYNLSFPLGDLKDYISDVGPTGFDAEWKGFLNENIAIGGKVGVISFYEKYPRDTYYFKNGALTTTIFNYYYTIPMQVVGDYFFNPSGFIQPFAGLGIGINYNERRTEIGFYAVEDNSWNFSLSPEAGVIVPFGKYVSWGFTAKARYNYQVYNRDRFNGMQFFDLSFGLSYSY
jgi:hypothetical protein